MSVIDVKKDFLHNRLTVVASYRASVERVWRLWADPRQLERWWGPPTYPSTVTAFDLVPGGIVSYHMTGPEGDQHHGGWRVLRVEEPHLLELEDYFAEADGTPNTDMPVSTSVISIEASDDGVTTMRIETTYDSVEAMQQVLDMGMEEGIRQSMGQIDDLLAEQPV